MKEEQNFESHHEDAFSAPGLIGESRATPELYSEGSMFAVSPSSLSYSEQRPSIKRKQELSSGSIVSCNIHGLPLSHWNIRTRKLVCARCVHDGTIEAVFALQTTLVRERLSISAPVVMGNIDAQLVASRDQWEIMERKCADLRDSVNSELRKWMDRIESLQTRASNELKDQLITLHKEKARIRSLVEMLEKTESMTDHSDMEQFLLSVDGLESTLVETHSTGTRYSMYEEDLESIRNDFTRIISGEMQLCPRKVSDSPSRSPQADPPQKLLSRLSKSMEAKGVSVSSLFRASILEVHEVIVSLNQFLKDEVDELLVFFEIQKQQIKT